MSENEMPESYVRRVIKKSHQDPGWYLKTFLRVESKEMGLVPLDVYKSKWRAQKYITDTIVENRKKGKPVRLVILKARHEGLTTVTAGLVFCTTTNNAHCKSLVIAQDPEASRQIHRKYQIFFDNLPRWYKPSVRYYSKLNLTFEKDPKKVGLEDLSQLAEEDSKEGFAKRLNLGIRSSIDVLSSNKADGYRGASIHCLHCTEIAFWPNADDVWAAIDPMISNSPQSIVILESTAFGPSGFFAGMWRDAVRGENGFTPLFIPWTWMPDYAVELDEHEKFSCRDEEEAMLVEKYNLTPQQVKFRRQKIRTFAAGYEEGGEEEALAYGTARFKGEYPITPADAFVLFKKTAFNNLRLDEMIARIETSPPKKEVYEIIPDDSEFKPNPFNHRWVCAVTDHFPTEKNTFTVWERAQPNHRYTVSMDPSPGGGDEAVIDVIRWMGRVQVAQWHGWFDPPDLAQIGVLIAKMYGEAMLAIEVTGMGTTVQACVNKLSYGRSYIWEYADKKKPDSSFLGWKTTEDSKRWLVGHARKLINARCCTINSLVTLNQMKTFIEYRGPTGETYYSGAPGCPDDAVVCWQIGCFTTHQKESTGMSGYIGGVTRPGDDLRAIGIQVQRGDEVDFDRFNAPSGVTADEL